MICYHADYPSERVSQWTEIYANDAAFAAPAAFVLNPSADKVSLV